MRKQMNMLLTAFYVTFTISYVVGVSPDLGAPDSNNLNMEFTPDDSAAGGLDTSLDNSNATPMIITTPPMTTSTTPTTPVTQPTTTTVQLSAPSSSTTSTTTSTTPSTIRTSRTTTSTTRPTTTTTTTTTTRTTTRALVTPPPTTTGKSDNNRLPPQFPYDPNPPFVPYPNGWVLPNQHNQHNQHNQQGTGQWSGGRLNIPWWMLLLEEV